MANRYQRDYTPTPVVDQGVRSLLRVLPDLKKAESVLDPSAGSGAFGSVFSKTIPRARTCAVESRREEEWWLGRNYDEYEIGDFKRHRTHDLVVTNPPFSLWEEFVETGLRCLNEGGILMLLGLTSWGSRSISGYETFMRYPPSLQMRITGTVAFQGPGRGTDTRDYCWWVWNHNAEGRVGEFWLSTNLPRLPSGDRRWKIPPGRETGYGIEEIQTCEEEFILSP
jgi:hypothetical protein